MRHVVGVWLFTQEEVENQTVWNFTTNIYLFYCVFKLVSECISVFIALPTENKDCITLHVLNLFRGYELWCPSEEEGKKPRLW